MDAERLRENWTSVGARVDEATRLSGRKSGDVRLVAVTKRVPASAVRALIDLGAKTFGENYPQELWEKVEEIPDPSVRWHLIGHLQGKKVKKTLPLVEMVHGVDTIKLLQSLNSAAAELPQVPSVCLQANLSGEPTKHGWTAEGLLLDAEEIARCRSIRVVGLMTMAGLGDQGEAARPTFAQLRQLRDELARRTGLALPELSMGMSGDFEAAIAEGATLVRVGSALFEGVGT
ncbi:YggS family pyridoxal phosphate-dependent enzyme [Isosphaeraceae bacterium EP7]